MPVQHLHRVKCDICGSTEQPYESEQDAIAHAIGLGWSAYPLLCRHCNTSINKKVRDEQVRRTGI